MRESDIPLVEYRAAVCRVLTAVAEFRQARDKARQTSEPADHESEDSAFHEMIHQAMELEVINASLGVPGAAQP